MVKKRIASVADLHSTTKSGPTPAPRSRSIRLWPGARSTKVAPCSAKGATTRVGVPPPLANSRSRIAGSSILTVFGVTQVGSSGDGISSGAKPRTSPQDLSAASLARIVAASGQTQESQAERGGIRAPVCAGDGTEF
jgi:hypothetical protein